ncbi:Type III secretory pathway, component EscS [Stappia aggregata IAM 12614]|uniref:Type III secretory pathway, component EscS n=1 Tax=Roseibium aggregatum (strain ATCC 25650 / DSM 13394 / JCM 20685 / NBRC 16684 / NCIMB 2208 / IAM 12614 / B1) TaxID=384765 RepID=A0P0L5_ROSAI|nr:type III secretion system export apparatus subunit SctS [Roseibium aggregatum]EAV41329.1 Type III secretory pathway, component EscS [Stappia aggregata IAM 12614] [Roseibium aggregatum IAM 12614]
MAPADALHVTTEAMFLVLLLSMPPILAASIVGLAVSLLQALTQIQEQTLPFAAKLIAVAISLAATSTYLGGEMYNFTMNLFDTFPELTR